MNFTTQNIFFILTGIACIGVLIIGGFLFDLKRKWNAMFGAAENDKELLGAIIKDLSQAKNVVREHDARLKVLEAISSISVQKVGFLRFNPFSETGGDNSFALTLLDRNNNGIVISSLYTRDGVRVYGKLIEKGTPKNTLSIEEEASLSKALKVS